MTKIIKNSSGQGLLEMVFAIGILMIAVSAILALTTSNVIGQKESESQIIANNLAREGIEVVRNQRDANWLSGSAWDFGLSGSGGGLSSLTAIPVFDRAANSWELDFRADTATTVNIFGGVYNQQKIGEAADGSPTPFSRLLTIYNICQRSDGTESVEVDCGEDNKIGVKVESKVNWIERNQPRKVQVEDLLYAWK